MKVFLLYSWICFIFICTCTSSFKELAGTGEIRFLWDNQPDFSELLLPLPQEINGIFLIQKSGHVLSFLILTILLHANFKSQAACFSLALIYAAITELLQLFFSRDGRLFDIGIDALGIFLALAIISLFNKDEVQLVSVPK